MRKIFVFLGILLISLTGTVSLQAKNNGVPEESSNGIYVKQYAIKGADKKFYYAADPVTQQCFSIIRMGLGAGYTTMPCGNLKKRPEWKNIVVWD